MMLGYQVERHLHIERDQGGAKAIFVHEVGTILNFTVQHEVCSPYVILRIDVPLNGFTGPGAPHQTF